MRLFLISHAQTDWNVEGRFQGQTDIPLNEYGRRQARQLQRHLANVPLDTLVASDLSRARETAEIIAMSHGMVVHTDRRLRELHFGHWEGLTYAEIQAKYPEALAPWQENSLRERPPGGESLAEMAQRLADFVGGLKSYADNARIAVVAHRGALRSMLCVLLGVPVSRHWEYRLDIASISDVEYVDGKGRMVTLNTTLGDA